MSVISQLIDGLARSRTEAAMERLVLEVKRGVPFADDIHKLADSMAKSGAVVGYRNGDTADLASTGGPGSLSTLLGPLYLRSRGLLVPKLGVPGRPAGGIDVLAQLPGYRYELALSEINEVLARSGYVHFLAGEQFAPLDAALFRYRQRVGAQNVPALAVASILAKKIACGVKCAGLDVRVAPHGNFGSTFAAAREAARVFCEAARMAGINAVGLLTDARSPYQPFIGRGEGLLALKLIFDKRADGWLSEHDHLCRLMATHVASLSPLASPGSEDIKTWFEQNIDAQGSSLDAFETKVDFVARGHRRELVAKHDGFATYDLEALRSCFVEAHANAISNAQFPDELGVILKVRPGSYVARGYLLASVRASDSIWFQVSERLVDALKTAELPTYAPGMEEAVRA
jgi:thymidine phosphorylase